MKTRAAAGGKGSRLLRGGKFPNLPVMNRQGGKLAATQEPPPVRSCATPTTTPQENPMTTPNGTSSPDVVVIGGGPAGSTVSTLLAQHGCRVQLYERERFPRFHIG